jgi:hypothetical protein
MWNRGETQTKIAPQWGMDQTTLSAKLRGKRPWFATEIDAAARHYGVTRDQLFSELPHLDSNQEPIGSQPELLGELTDLNRERRIRRTDRTESTERTAAGIVTSIAGHA